MVCPIADEIEHCGCFGHLAGPQRNFLAQRGILHLRQRLAAAIKTLLQAVDEFLLGVFAVQLQFGRSSRTGKRTAQDKWDIWEMDLDGKNKRQITREFGNCREPEYLARSSITPPDFDDKVRWITFISDAAGAYEEGKAELATSLYAASLEPVQGRGFVIRRSTRSSPENS